MFYYVVPVVIKGIFVVLLKCDFFYTAQIIVLNIIAKHTWLYGCVCVEIHKFKYGTCTFVYHSVDTRIFYYDSYFVSVLYGSVFWRNEHFILLKPFPIYTFSVQFAFCCKIYLLSQTFTLSKKEM